MPRPLIEHPETYELPLEGFVVRQLVLDDGLALRLSAEAEDQAGGEVRVEGEFVLGSPSERWEGGSGHSPFAPCATLHLLRKTIATAVATKEGQLDLRFADGWWLQVGRDPAYEPWMVHVDRDGRGDWLKVVSTPGGELAIWLPAPE